MVNDQNPNNNPTINTITEVIDETVQKVKTPLTRLWATATHLLTMAVLGATARWGGQQFGGLERRLMSSASLSFSTEDFKSAIIAKAHKNPTKNQLWFESVSDMAMDNGYVWSFAKMEWPAEVTSQVHNYAFQVYRGLKSSIICVFDLEKGKVLFNDLLSSSAEGVTVGSEEIRFTCNGKSELSSITFPCRIRDKSLDCTITKSGAEIKDGENSLFISENGEPFKSQPVSSTQAAPVALPA